MRLGHANVQRHAARLGNARHHAVLCIMWPFTPCSHAAAPPNQHHIQRFLPSTEGGHLITRLLPPFIVQLQHQVPCLQPQTQLLIAAGAAIGIQEVGPHTLRWLSND